MAGLSPSDRRTGRLVSRDVLAVLVCQVLFSFGWSLYLLLPKFYTKVLSIGPHALGHLTAVGGMTGLLTAPVTGYALDRLGRVAFFRCGCLLLFLLSVIFSRVQEVGPLLYLLQGLMIGSFVLAWNAAAALITDHTPSEHMGRVIGWLGGVNVLMNAAAAIVAEPLAAQHGWSAVFLLGAVAAALALAASLWMRDVEAEDANRLRTSALPVALPFLSMGVVMAAAVLQGGAFIAVFHFVQPYALWLGAREVRAFLLGFSAAAVMCRVFMGGLGDHFGRDIVSAWALVTYAVCALSMAWLHVPALFLYGLLFGVGHGVLYPTLNALLAQIMPAQRRGLAMVLYNAAFNLGTAVGSWNWGRIAERRGYPAMYQWAACAALAAASLLWWRRPGRLERD